MSKFYNDSFYDGQADDSITPSLEAVVGAIAVLLRPQSILDVGCSLGRWCAAFRTAGASVAHGIDGPWVNRDRLHIPKEDFFEIDFSLAPAPYAFPSPVPRYDVVLSLEFLEHVDPSRARDAVAFICGLTDVVVAGAAIPGQGGVNHVNEQWPDYWAALFAEHGFQPYDALRLALWDKPGLRPWYAQNTILYFRGDPPPAVVAFAEKAAIEALNRPKRFVHPEIFKIHLARPSWRRRMLDWAKRLVGWR